MSNIVVVKKAIRKAIETPLYNAAVANGLLVKWPNLALNRAEGSPPPEEYIDVAHSFGRVIVHEMGPNPLVSARGTMSCIVRTPLAQGVDRNDTIAGIIVAAYPYGVQLVRDGIKVNIDTADTSGYGEDGAWVYSSALINWFVYRRS